MTFAKRTDSKYGAKRTTVDGITFDSLKESRRYQELQLLVLAGLVAGLELQPRFPLLVPTAGDDVTIGEYRADFAYRDLQRGYVVEDVKGFRTALYRWKKKHVEAQYGITIVEV